MSKSSVILLCGAITGVLQIAYFMGLYLSQTTNVFLSFAVYILLFACLWWSIVYYRNKANDGYLKFGEGYKVNMLIMLVVSAIYTVFLWIFMNTHPDFIEKMVSDREAAMVNYGMTPEQIKEGVAKTREFMTPNIMGISTFIVYLIVGGLLGLLSVGISTKAKPFFEEDNNTQQL